MATAIVCVLVPAGMRHGRKLVMKNLDAKRITRAIMVALVIWGICLAVGATGFLVDDALFDPTRSVFVVFFVVLFLGTWGLILRAVRVPKKSLEEGAAHTLPWSWPGVISLLMASCGALLWIGAVVSWQRISAQSTTLMGWGAAMLLAGGVTAGMVALSDRRSRRGKWLGLLSMAGCFLSLFVYVARMS